MGDNVYLCDRDGVRTPMQWSGDRNAGFSRANPQRLILPTVIDHEYHYQTVNVEAQEQNRHSLLWWMRRLIALRKQFRAFGRGSIDFLSPDNPRVVAFVRSYEDENILVVANLSRFVQHVELDLSKHRGSIPIELFGRTSFPAIGDRPYTLSLGSHVFYWFALSPPPGAGPYAAPSSPLPKLEMDGDWESLLKGDRRAMLERVLPGHLFLSRWFSSKARPKTARIVDVIPLAEDCNPCITIVEVEFTEGESERYLLPLGFVADAAAHELRDRAPEQVIADISLVGKSGPRRGIICDATADLRFGRLLLDVIERRRRIKGEQGEMLSALTRSYKRLRGEGMAPAPRVVRADQANSSIVYGDRLMLKLFRRPDEGINPDLEVGRFLSDKKFTGAPELAGALEFHAPRKEPMTFALVQGFVPHQADAAAYSHEELKRFFERVVTKREWGPIPASKSLIDLLAEQSPGPAVTDMIGAYLDAAKLLGRRTA